MNFNSQLELSETVGLRYDKNTFQDLSQLLNSRRPSGDQLKRK